MVLRKLFRQLIPFFDSIYEKLSINRERSGQKNPMPLSHLYHYLSLRNNLWNQNFGDSPPEIFLDH